MVDALQRRFPEGPHKGKGEQGGDDDRKGPGKQPARGRALWYALYLPRLDSMAAPATAPGKRRRLERIAALCQHYSDHISLLPPATVVFEVRGSLRYFRGIAALREQLTAELEQSLQEQGEEALFFQAASPTASASALLARSGSNLLIHHAANLRSALGRLSLDCLPISAGRKEQLHKSGLRLLRDLWRLPTASLRKRLGNETVDHLQRCLGQRPETPPRWQPPPAFHSCHQAEWPLETLAQLSPVFEELLEELQVFLHRRALAVEQIRLRLHHDSRESSRIVINLRQAGRCASQLLMLLETRLENLPLPSPVLAVSLTARHFSEHQPRSAALDIGDSGSDGERAAHESINALLEQLQARLGPEAIRGLRAFDAWCPEEAGGECQDGGYGGNREAQRTRPDSTIFHYRPQRPAWLIQPPLALTVREGRPFHQGPLSLLDGPERIESHWWTGRPVRRDYYVAADKRGARLWIFTEHRATAAGASSWYLHGLFA